MISISIRFIDFCDVLLKDFLLFQISIIWTSSSSSISSTLWWLTISCILKCRFIQMVYPFFIFTMISLTFLQVWLNSFKVLLWKDDSLLDKTIVNFFHLLVLIVYILTLLTKRKRSIPGFVNKLNWLSLLSFINSEQTLILFLICQVYSGSSSWWIIWRWTWSSTWDLAISKSTSIPER